MFETLEPAAPDAIIGLIAEYGQDPRDEKVDLGIGVYRDADGNTPVLGVVKQAEQRLVDNQATKAYIGSAGSPEFCEAMARMTFADSVERDRLALLQTPGGSGSLRVAAGVILRGQPRATVWVSEPTWANHVPLLGGAGLTLEPYPYYDGETHEFRAEAMLDALRKIPKGEMVLLHACCHNPTGIDPDESQWRAIADVVVERELVPLIDIAYQGFAADLDADAFPIRYLAAHVPEMIVCNSCSKNFGLYRDRVGLLAVLGSDVRTRGVIQSQANNVVRTMYSMPPDHGAAVVATILDDPGLRGRWLDELGEMRERLRDVRKLLHESLEREAPGRDFSHLVRARGMFSFLGLNAAQVARLKTDHGVYMVDSSRINVAGVTARNAGYLASSIAAVL